MGVLKFLTVVFVLCGSLWAMPALDRFFAISQPDGSSLRVRPVGNESHHFKVTENGFVVDRDSAGYFCYVREDGQVSNVRAHDSENQTAEELSFLNSLNKEEVLRVVKSQKTSRTFGSIHKAEGSFEPADFVPAMRLMPKANSLANKGEKKALVILVQFSDVKFKSDDPKAQFESFLNEEGYSVNGNLGSVKDYFTDNSSGKFIPDFDVVGPVTISGQAYKSYGNYSRYEMYGGAFALMEALDTLVNQKSVDFTQYDSDKDGYLDFVHMIYAGVGSNDSPQDSAIWPHMYYLSASNYRVYGMPSQGKRVASSGSGFRKSYTYVDAYACSNELDGKTWETNRNSSKIVGVGGFAHEFSHLLGLGDHYSAESNLYTLSVWDLMDGGAYNISNSSAVLGSAPPYYSAFEKEYLGWSKSVEISEGDGFELLPVQENASVKVTNPKNTDEFYVMEYRNRSKWDVGLPNHGMLIWHIDYDDSAWIKSEINTSKRMRVDIVEADGAANYQTITSDVFPGTSRLRRYDSFSKFVTWDGTDLGVHLSSIAEANDYSKVSFNVKFGDFYELPPESSSSEEMVVESSSSSLELVDASSSSEEVAEDNSDPVETDFVRNQLGAAGLMVSRKGGVLKVSGMPQGLKVVRVFSLNGNLLKTLQVETDFISLDVDRRFGKTPVIIQIAQNRKIIAVVPLK